MTDSTIHSTQQYDVVVIGAGHAGCEAALAAARCGASTLVATPNLDRTGYMPCNPSIGGPGKSHLVAEVDSLGGAMARVADATRLHVRVLNTSKGPAVQAVRSQQDKSLYAMTMKETLESQPGVDLVQDEIIGLQLDSSGSGRPRVTGVTCKQRGVIGCKSIIVTAGTFLRAALIAGASRDAGARAGDRSDGELSGSLASLGFVLRRLKTGTPPRLDGATIDFSECEEQAGDPGEHWLSRNGRLGRVNPIEQPPLPLHPRASRRSSDRFQLSCFRTGTSLATHELIRQNLHRAPMFNGSIDGIGPRYCPSVEDKVARFDDKSSHPIFLEPEGWRTSEYYVHGMSTSLPFDVQDQAIRTIPGLANARITRFGYAVEYDAVDPSEISTALESRRIEGLFLAGQVNGTSGYEEAAGQGILAGLNAANIARDQPLISLGRDQAYIGVMVDDLASKPFDEPYRMLTSRAEFRLSLRPETADERLGQLAYDAGLVDRERFDETLNERSALDQAIVDLKSVRVYPGNRHQDVIAATAIGSIAKPATLFELFRRPSATVADIDSLAKSLGVSAVKELSHALKVRLDQEIKYGAFVEREAREVARSASMERRLIPEAVDFHAINGLRIEARAKLTHHRPRTFGEASRLSGVTPADIAVLLVHATQIEAGIA
ncbi:tRNA uridine-5-carboxymethylaminomethyl(34) synthesis enzyme MnmG [soil metagenome]